MDGVHSNRVFLRLPEEPFHGFVPSQDPRGHARAGIQQGEVKDTPIANAETGNATLRAITFNVFSKGRT